MEQPAVPLKCGQPDLREPLSKSVARAIAAALAAFALLNIVGEARTRHFDATVWWLDLRPLPTPGAVAFIGCLSIALLAFAAWRRA